MAKNDLTEGEIFRFLNADDNDLLSEMNGFDLQDLLYYMEKYYLEYRRSLGIAGNVTFGLELEFENTVMSWIQDKMKNLG